MKNIILGLSFIGVAVLVIGLLLISPIIAYSTDELVVFNVKDKERVVTGSGDSMTSKYLVYTDKGVYENTDTIWYWKWNSSDVYNDLEVGKTYQVKVYGFRIPFLSWYKNVVEVVSSN